MFVSAKQIQPAKQAKAYSLGRSEALRVSPRFARIEVISPRSGRQRLTPDVAVARFTGYPHRFMVFCPWGSLAKPPVAPGSMLAPASQV